VSTVDERPEGAPRDLAGILRQKKWWRTRTGEWVRVKDMAESHRHNVARLLLRNARAYSDQIYMRESLIAADAPDGVWNAIEADAHRRDSDPVGWMRRTKLFRQMSKGMGAPSASDLNRKLAEQAERDVVETFGGGA
jgi:hypothetical protein